jgi:uncharacterized protein
MKKLIIAGGTGFLGTALIKYLEKDFDEIVIFSRGGGEKKGNIKTVAWDAKSLGTWKEELEDADVVINLTGKNINCRLTKKNKNAILHSRVNATNVIGEAISLCQNPPRIWINGSATNMYENSLDQPMTEANFIPAEGFWTDVCIQWENACLKWQLPLTRRVIPRITPVFGKRGGIFPVLQGLVKKGLGGTMGLGNQKVSWIHEEDFCSIVKWMIENETVEGSYNVCSPEVISNEEQMRMMRKVIGVPFGMPTPGWILEIGAFFMRTESDLILNSRYVYPERLVNEGFVFKFASFQECMRNLTNGDK